MPKILSHRPTGPAFGRPENRLRPVSMSGMGPRLNSTAIGSNRVVLFDSRARGDAHEASDYDIAVFLKDLTDRWREFRRLADLRTDILADTEVFIEARPFRRGAYRERTPLMHEIPREGVDF